MAGACLQIFHTFRERLLSVVTPESLPLSGPENRQEQPG